MKPLYMSQGSRSVRIVENGVKTEKLLLKHDSRSLFVENLKLEGL
jgi:hypothetical protein